MNEKAVETTRFKFCLNQLEDITQSPFIANKSLEWFLDQSAVYRSDCRELKSGSEFTDRCQERSLSFSPRFSKFECNITSDWLNCMVQQ